MAITKVFVLVERGVNEEILVGASNDDAYVERVRDVYRKLHPDRRYFMEAIDFIEAGPETDALLR